MAAVGSRAGSRYFLLSVSSVAIIVAAVSLLVVPINALWLRPFAIPTRIGASNGWVASVAAGLVAAMPLRQTPPMTVLRPVV